MSGDSAASPSAQRGRVLLEQGRYPEAEKYFREALALDPNDSQLLFQLALCQWQQDEKGKEALATIKRAIGLEPNDGSFFALQAMIHASLRQGREALLSSEKAIALQPYSPFSFNAKTSAYLSMQKWSDAEASAREALALDPDNETASNHLAVALRLQGKLEQNAEQIAFMLSRNPEDSYTHANAGWNCLQRGDRKQAEVHFLEALRLNAENEHARHGLIETFRARSPVYRSYLAYCFFMQRFTGAQQWAMIIGLLVLVRFSDALLRGPYALLGMIVVGLYLLFVLWVHVARGVGNFLVAIDRTARRALRKNERMDGFVVGGGVFLGLLLLVSSLVDASGLCLIAGLTFIGASLPFAYTFTNESKFGKQLFGAIGIFVLCAGAIKFMDAAGIIDATQMSKSLTGLAFIAAVATTWLSNVPQLRR